MQSSRLTLDIIPAAGNGAGIGVIWEEDEEGNRFGENQVSLQPPQIAWHRLCAPFPLKALKPEGLQCYKSSHDKSISGGRWNFFSWNSQPDFKTSTKKACQVLIQVPRAAPGWVCPDPTSGGGICPLLSKRDVCKIALVSWLLGLHCTRETEGISSGCLVLAGGKPDYYGHWRITADNTHWSQSCSVSTDAESLLRRKKKKTSGFVLL